MTERQEEVASALPGKAGFIATAPRVSAARHADDAVGNLYDAAFAFAVTMLVIAAQQIPDNIASLLAAFRNVPTFVSSIAVLGIFFGGAIGCGAGVTVWKMPLPSSSAGDDCDNPDLYLPVKGNFRGDVVPFE